MRSLNLLFKIDLHLIKIFLLIKHTLLPVRLISHLGVTAFVFVFVFFFWGGWIDVKKRRVRD